MSRSLLRAAIVLLFIPLLAGCPARPRPVRQLVVVGCRGLVPLAQQIADRFCQGRDDVQITLEVVEPDQTVRDTRTGLADIGLIGRGGGPAEADLRRTPLALDGLAVVLHPSNRVPDLDDNRLMRLLTREYTSWQDVGASSAADGNPPSQTPFLVGQGRGPWLREVLAERFGLRPEQLRFDLLLPSAELVGEEVARKPAALGLLSLSVAERMKTAERLRVLPYAGVPATMANLRAGRYGLFRQLTLLTRERNQEAVQQFLDFATSPAVDDLLLAHGFLPVPAP